MPRSAMWPPAPCAQMKSGPPEDASAGSKIAEVSSSPTLTRHLAGDKPPAVDMLAAGGVRPGERGLFHPVLDLREGRAGALLVEVPARSAAHSDRTDRRSTGNDG